MHVTGEGPEGYVLPLLDICAFFAERNSVRQYERLIVFTFLVMTREMLSKARFLKADSWVHL